MPGDCTEPPPSGESCEEELRLGPRETFADTGPRPAPEREVGPPWTRRPALLGPALRIEPIRFRKPARVAMRHVRAEDHDRPRRNNVGARFEVDEGSPADQPCRRVEAARPPPKHLFVVEPPRGVHR